MQIVDEGHNLPNGDIAVNRLDAAVPDDRHDAEVDHQRQRGRHAGHELHHPDVAVGKIRVGNVETLHFAGIAHKGFDHARPGDVLLQDTVEPVEALLHRQEERAHFGGKKNNQPGGNQQDGQHDSRQFGVGVVHQNQAADHQQRGAGADAQENLRQPLENRRIAGEAHH